MRITRFDAGSIGIVVGDRIVDVSDIAGADDPAGPPVAMNRLIADFARHRPALQAAAAQRPGLPLAQVKLLTPVPAASKVIAYPINYHDHGVEMNNSTRANHAGFFLKPPSSLCGASDDIVLPAIVGRRIDHECELAIVIGQRCRDVAREDWASVVFGYSCLMDIVVRGKEERVARKAYDTFCPVGPWIVTADELGSPHALQGRLWVNDALRQDANTRDLVLDIPGMIEVASHIMTLEPGDIIACGTPAGVGPIQGGDVVRIEFERIGGMTMNVVQGRGGRASIFAAAPVAAGA
jgi:2-keto-4-pentenoate hydratase/2-oxohepta-3-ene-1,7-dioic acid hydratase in catechol pathway